MKTEKLEYRLYGQVVLNWFTGKMGPEKVLTFVTLTVEQTWNEKEQKTEWHRIGGPRQFVWTAKTPTKITRVAIQSPKSIASAFGKERTIPMSSIYRTIEPKDTVTITITEKVLQTT